MNYIDIGMICASEDIMASKRKRDVVNPIWMMFTLIYGTAEIVSFEGAWRIEIYRPFVVHPSEPWNREIRERIMVARPGDISPRHGRDIGYDARCSCCYLNIPHTVDAHAARAA